jgi:hypothetical protein
MATVETTHDVPLERDRLLALGAALLTVTLWASAFVGIRAAGRDLSPGALALGRLLVASVALGAFALARRERLPARGDLPGIALCGILWFALYSVVLNEAERTVDAGTAAMLVNVGPILIAVLAGSFSARGFRAACSRAARSRSPARSSSASRRRAALCRAGARSSASSQLSRTPAASWRRSRCLRA